MLIRSLFLSGCVLVVRASRVNARAMVSTANPTPAIIGYGRISGEDLDVITGIITKVSGDKGWKAHESDCVKGLIFFSHPKGGTRWTIPGPDSSTSFVQPSFGSAAWNKEGDEDQMSKPMHTPRTPSQLADRARSASPPERSRSRRARGVGVWKDCRQSASRKDDGDDSDDRLDDSRRRSRRDDGYNKGDKDKRKSGGRRSPRSRSRRGRDHNVGSLKGHNVAEIGYRVAYKGGGGRREETGKKGDSDKKGVSYWKGDSDKKGDSNKKRERDKRSDDDDNVDSGKKRESDKRSDCRQDVVKGDKGGSYRRSDKGDGYRRSDMCDLRSDKGDKDDSWKGGTRVSWKDDSSKGDEWGHSWEGGSWKDHSSKGDEWKDDSWKDSSSAGDSWKDDSSKGDGWKDDSWKDRDHKKSGGKWVYVENPVGGDFGQKGNGKGMEGHGFGDADGQQVMQDYGQSYVGFSMGGMDGCDMSMVMSKSMPTPGFSKAAAPPRMIARPALMHPPRPRQPQGPPPLNLLAGRSNRAAVHVDESPFAKNPTQCGPPPGWAARE